MKRLTGKVVTSELGRNYRVTEVVEEVISLEELKEHTIIAFKAQKFLELFSPSIKQDLTNRLT
jgi:hypothetical protein